MDWINLSDIQVNSVLGQLRVIGDVGRDVLLTLSDPGASPVSIQVVMVVMMVMMAMMVMAMVIMVMLMMTMTMIIVVTMMVIMAMIMMIVMTSPPRRQAAAQPAWS